ncbi:hypothetical protein J4447_02955 [Candidatus Pacearchaeota archaeon]|nr:hypothetical protein [Candidatus Pacearchaeota archaeon]
MTTISLERKLEQNEDSNLSSNISLSERIKQSVRNYLIDTSAKVVCYASLMAGMEAYNGLNPEQILSSRTAAALVDAGAARIYTKTADYVEEKTKPLTKKVSRSSIKVMNALRKDNLNFGQMRGVYRTVEGVRKYSADTASMIGVYTPVYAGILASTGADAKQIGASLLMGAGIAAATSRLFRKYALVPWRKLCGYKK